MQKTLVTKCGVVKSEAFLDHARSFLHALVILYHSFKINEKCVTFNLVRYHIESS